MQNHDYFSFSCSLTDYRLDPSAMVLPVFATSVMKGSYGKLKAQSRTGPLMASHSTRDRELFI